MGNGAKIKEEDFIEDENVKLITQDILDKYEIDNNEFIKIAKKLIWDKRKNKKIKRENVKNVR